MKSLLDLPHEILLEILVQFESYHSYEALLKTCKLFRTLLTEVIIVISDREIIENNGLKHFNLNKLSIEEINDLIQRYNYFLFDLSCKNGITDTIGLMKIILKKLQLNKKYHSITIKNSHSSQSINSNPLVRFLLPKMKSSYTEFFFPRLRTINGCDDLRLLDNTHCYFAELTRLTVGSFAFQWFRMKAPYLKTITYSDQLKKRSFNDTSSKIEVFLSNLTFTDQLEYIEIVSKVNPLVLSRFQNLKVLKIYGNHITKSFNFDFFDNLKELVINKCNLFEEIENFNEYIINESLELLDLSNNKSFSQKIRGDFKNLRLIDLSFTNITEKPQIWYDVNKPISMKLQGCQRLIK